MAPWRMYLATGCAVATGCVVTVAFVEARPLLYGLAAIAVLTLVFVSHTTHRLALAAVRLSYTAGRRDEADAHAIDHAEAPVPPGTLWSGWRAR